jgi:hypothetical protein
MKSKFLWWVLGILGFVFLLSSVTITIVEYQRFKARTAVFPAGSTIAGVPVGELDAAGAEARLADYYNLPLTLNIETDAIRVSPQDLGFVMDVPALVQAGLGQVQSGGYWAALWNRTTTSPVTLPLEATVDREKLVNFLNTEISPRYTQPGSPVTPILNTTNFDLSASGSHLDLDSAVANIEAALLSPDIHEAKVPVLYDAGGAASYATLETFLLHNIDWVGFDGLVEVSLKSLADGQSLHFAVWGGEPVAPDIAYSGFSTIKIPIIISLMRRLEEPYSDTVINLMEEMIVNSENAAADTLMEYFINETRGPLVVSEDIAALGLQNTFLAGYFYPGAPILQLFNTPANSRTDVDLDPDLYNQVTLSELGTLLEGIYHCAENNTGILVETFPGEITQSECRSAIDILTLPKPLQFIMTSLPPEAVVADKYGYGLDMDGIFRTITDNAIVYTPGGDFILSVAVYDPDWLNAADGQRVIGRLSQTVYNFFNLENQAYWWFDTQ